MFIFLAAIFLIVFLIGFLRAFLRDYQIKKEIRELETIKINLEKKKIKTLEMLDDLESNRKAEEEARLNFGLVKPGERVVIITSDTKKISNQAADIVGKNKRESNPSLWWRYFFGKI